MKFRNKVLHEIELIDRSGHIFQDLGSLYSSMSDYWSVLVDLGDGILACRDLEELKVRKEITTKCANITSRYSTMLNNECHLIINEAKEKLYSSNIVDRINKTTIDRINGEHSKILNKVHE